MSMFPEPVQDILIGGVTSTGRLVGEADGWKAPASNNRIVVVSGFEAANKSLTVPTGYSLLGSAGSGAQRPKVAAFMRDADGSEDEVLVEWSASGQWAARILEFDEHELELSVVAGAVGGSTTDSIAQDSGTTAVDIEGFAYAVFVSHQYNGETPTNGGGFSFDVRALAGGDGDLVLDFFKSSLRQDVAGTYGMTGNWSSQTTRTGLLGAFQVWGAGTANMKITDKQKTDRYSVVQPRTGANVWVDHLTLPNGVELKGLSRGQAKKAKSSLTFPTNVKTDAAAVARRALQGG